MRNVNGQNCKVKHVLKRIRIVVFIAGILVPLHPIWVLAATAEVSPEWRAHFDSKLVVENCVFERVAFSSSNQTNLYQVRYQENAFVMREIGKYSDATIDHIVGGGMYAGRSGSNFWAIEGGRVLKLFPNAEALVSKFAFPDISLIEAPRRTLIGALFLGLYLLDPKSFQWTGDKSFVGNTINGKRIRGVIMEIAQGLPTTIEWEVEFKNKMRFETKYNYFTNLDLTYYPSEILVRAISKGELSLVVVYRVLFLKASPNPLSEDYFDPSRYFTRSSSSQVIIFTNNDVYGQVGDGGFEKIKKVSGGNEMYAGSRIGKTGVRLIIFAFFILSAIGLFLTWKNTKRQHNKP